MQRLRRWRQPAACAAIAFLTYTGIAGFTPGFPSHSILLLQEGYKTNATPELAAGLFAAVSEKSNLRMLRQLIYSDETMREVDRSTGFFKYFSDRGNWVERWLAGQSDPDRRAGLYMHAVEVKVDDRSGLVLVDARAHDAETARRIGAAIVAVAQRRVNDLAQRVAADQMSYLEGEAKRLLEDDRKSQQQLAEFQRKTGLTGPEIGIAVGPVSPNGGGGGVSGEQNDLLVGWLQRRGDLQVKLQSMKQFLKPDAPELQAVQAELNAVQTQIDARKQELTSRREGSVGGARAEFVNLMTAAELTRELYLGSLRSIAQARADASRTLKRVDLVQAPTLATAENRDLQWNALVAAAVIAALSWKLMSVGRQYVKAHND